MSELQPWMDRVEYLRRENIRLEAEIERLRAARERIASCEKRADGDVVDIARTALGKTGGIADEWEKTYKLSEQK
jgi:hypothetical protein